MTWTPIADADLRALLAGAANGHRTDAERAGDFVIARRPARHSIDADAWEVWRCRGERWEPLLSVASKSTAREHADRLRALAEGRRETA